VEGLGVQRFGVKVKLANIVKLISEQPTIFSYESIKRNITDLEQELKNRAF